MRGAYGIANSLVTVLVQAILTTMGISEELGLANEYTFGVEVHVDDADVLFGDAVELIKTGGKSPLLRAIDLKQAVAVMSERAFHELGWMSAKAARGHGVTEIALRALLEGQYLPRIAVVVMPTAGDPSWIPDASDVIDVNDVQHASLARLINARAVYSHDKHL